MIYVETNRLLLRDWKETDLTVFKAINGDEEVMRYFPQVLTETQTNQFYQAIQDEFKAFGYGLYAVERKIDGRFIGFIGFHRTTFDADFTPCIEIGWRLAKESWNQGYATEGAAACMTYGWNILGFQKLYSFTAALNKPSIRVMDKIGMTFQHMFYHPTINTCSPLCQHVLYLIENRTHSV